VTPQPDSTPPGRAAVVTVVAAALVAAAARLPATAAPLGPDESGYTMVGRAWAPQPDSPFGPYWVDRPPLLIAVFRSSDALGGLSGIRWLAVLAAALAVFAAAVAALEVVAHVRPAATRHEASVIVGLTAVAAAALVSNPSIDVLLAKGEILSVNLLLGSMGLALRAVRTRSTTVAVVAGILATAAPGLKQNLVGGVVFAVTLVGLEWWRRRIDTASALRLGGALALGMSLPVLGTVIWALVAGVHLSALWDSIVGVRSDAIGVLIEGSLGTGRNLQRIKTLAVVSVTSGIALVLAGLVAHVVRRRRAASSVAWAALVVACVDGAGLVLGGYFRLPYLYAIVPSTVVALALLLTLGTDRPRRYGRLAAGLLVVVVVASAVASAVPWLQDLPRFQRPSTPVMLGRSIGAVSEPGDSLTMLFGSANTQIQSGLPSPYLHLWSLLARTRDPHREEIRRVLEGSDAPTWVVATYDVGGMVGEGDDARLGAVLRARYEEVGTACGGREVYRRIDRPRPDPVLRCAALRREYGADWVAPVS
jgi:hypothetical protein